MMPVLDRYLKNSSQPRTFKDRLFLRARWKLTPYADMARELPRSGKILDLGCGHGLLSMVLALEAPEREVLGIDHDAARIAQAQEAARGISNLRFEEGSVLAPPPGPYDGIALIDTLHYFEPKLQDALIQGMAGALRPGGIVIIREVDPEAGMVSKWNRLYEKMATGSGFTRTSKGTAGTEGKSLHFRTPEEWLKVMRRSGLEASFRPCSHFLFADRLLIGKKVSQL